MKKKIQSHRGDLTARMIELLLMLSDRAPSQSELVKHFGVDRKTIKRAVDALSIHYPVIEERDGKLIRYRLSDEFQFSPPSLTASEIAVLLLARESISATGITSFGSPFSQHVRGLILKIRAALPAPLREKLDNLTSVFGTAAVSTKDYSSYSEIINRLVEAAIEGYSMRMVYHSLSDDQTKERLIDPYCIYFDPDGATLKLAAYDQIRCNVIPFSIDRILALFETGKQFIRPPGFNLSEYLVKNCFNGIHGTPISVTLRAYNVTSRIFRERSFHPSQQIVEDTSEFITINMNVAGGRGLVRFILSWAPDVEIIEPESLRREVADVHRQALTNF
jgi:predicted DNA-binding transcriptional regulator YafY